MTETEARYWDVETELINVLDDPGVDLLRDVMTLILEVSIRYRLINSLDPFEVRGVANKKIKK